MNADAAANFARVTGRYPNEYEEPDIDAAWGRMGYDQFDSWAGSAFGRASISPPAALVPFPGGNLTTTAAPPASNAFLGAMIPSLIPTIGGLISKVLPRGTGKAAVGAVAGSIIPGLLGPGTSGKLPLGTGLGFPGAGPGGKLPVFLGGTPNPPEIPGTIVVYKQNAAGKTTGQAQVIDRTGKVVGTWVWKKKAGYWEWHSGRLTRRMNVMNGKALGRANRRVTGFANVAGRVLHQLGYNVSSTRHVRKVKVSRKRR